MGKVSQNVAKVLAPGSPYSTSRLGYANTREADKRHARQIGTIIHAWNRAHAEVFGVFMRVVASGDYELAHAIWHSLATDSARRALLKSAVQVKLRSQKRFMNSTLWALSILDELAKDRNDAAHAEMVRYLDRMEPGISAKPASAKRLEERTIEGHWKKLAGDLQALSEYLMMISMNLFLGNKTPSCKRPRLQFSRSTNGGTQARRRQAK